MAALILLFLLLQCWSLGSQATAFSSLEAESSETKFYTNCANSSYGCLTFPEGCAATSKCSLGATWIGLSATTYDMHLLGGSGEYVAIGFPQIAGMGPAPVFACDTKNSKPVVG